MPFPKPDPFETILAPALRGEDATTRTRIAAIPAAAGDPWFAVAARAMWALGEPTAGRRAMHRALDQGGPQADALASLACPDPSAPLARRRAATDPAIRADAACDLAWRHLQAGDRGAAAGAIEHALHDAPHHAEARHWWDWLQSPGEPVQAVIALSRSRPAPRDARALCPQPSLGWFSPERWWRRVVGGLWSRPAPGGSALRRLQAWGIVSRALGSELAYARMPQAHPRVLAERALDRAQSRARQGRCPADAAAEAWRLMGRVAPDTLLPMAKALTRLGADHPGAAPTGLIAVETLHQLEPARCSWPAARARILAHLRRPEAARTEARAVLRRSDLQGPAIADALHALSLSGAAEEAREIAKRVCHDRRLAGTAERLLKARRPRPSLGQRGAPRLRQERPRSCRPRPRRDPGV